MFESCVLTPYQLFARLYCPFCETNDQLWHQCYPQWKATDVLLYLRYEGDSTLCLVYSALWSNLCIQCRISMKGRLHKIYSGNQHAHDMLGFVGRRYDSRTRDLNVKNNTNKQLYSAIQPPCWSGLSPFGDLFRASVFARYNLKSLYPGAGNTQCSRACLLFLHCASGNLLSAKHVESRHSKLFEPWLKVCAEYRDVFLSAPGSLVTTS